MEKSERRYLLKALSPKLEERAGKPSAIVGHAAVFFDGTPETEYELWEGMRERVSRGAFDRAIKEAQDVRALFNHDSNMILGRTAAGTLALSVDKVGLKYEIDVGSTTVARDVVEHLKRGDLTGSSFGFIVRGQSFATAEDGVGEVRTITDVDLLDVGPVTFPAYTGTDVTAVRAFRDSTSMIEETLAAIDAVDTAREEERLRRAAACLARALEVEGRIPKSDHDCEKETRA